ncbi:MAG: methyltransferase domain-containing protein [Halobacteriovoraceae bacterium]|nr:methyltransferase domain-containing protein [Halobacteriovoraceae bacterium]
MESMNSDDFKHLTLIAGGHTAFQLMWSGIELGLFDLLNKEGPKSLEEVAAKLGLDLRPTRILLTGLASLDLLDKENGQYSNSRISKNWLIAGHPGNIADIMGWQRYIVYEGQIDFTRALKENKNIGIDFFPGNGDTLYQRLQSDPFKQKVFQDSMSALSKIANSEMVRSLDLSQVKHIVDAGGGNGTNAIALATKNPHLKVTVLDSEPVCKLAQENILKNNLQERVFTKVGNFFNADFPDEIDAVIYCHIMTIWSLDEIVQLLKNTYNALPKGGQVIIFNMMGNDEDTGPLSTALGSPYFLSIATGKGMLYSWSDYINAMEKAVLHFPSR